MVPKQTFSGVWFDGQMGTSVNIFGRHYSKLTATMAAVIAEATGAAVIAKWAKAIYELPVEATVCASGQVTIAFGPRSTAIGTKSRHEIPEG